MTIYAGIDVGGTNVKLGLTDERCRVLARASIATDAQSGPAECVKRIAASLNQMRKGRPIRAACAGVPGPLDARRTMLVKAVNMPAWRRVPFPALLTRALGVPSHMENDANCAGLGEYAGGAGRGAHCMVLYTLGTGVGGGIVIGGKLWAGHNGGAGELGHMSIDPRGPVCGCGQRGCVEVYASATALMRQYRELGGRRATTARDVFASREAAARRAVDASARALGTGVAAMLHVLHPDIIVLSGGMAAGRGLLQIVRKEVRRRVFPLYLQGLRIVRGTLGDDAGWVGAAMVARERTG